MPSPLAHLTVGYVIHRLTDAKPHPVPTPSTPRWVLAPQLLLLLAFSLLPDVDAFAGLLAGDLGHFHNQWTHSLFVGLLAALAVALAFWRGRGPFPWANWGLLTLAYGLHSLMDAATLHGRGVMLFWPFSPERFHTPVRLFSGVQWSDGVWASAHLWTLFTEALFAAVILLLARGWLVWRRAGRTRLPEPRRSEPRLPGQEEA